MKVLLTVGQLQSRCELLLSAVWNKDCRCRQYTANSPATVSNCTQRLVIRVVCILY